MMMVFFLGLFGWSKWLVFFGKRTWEDEMLKKTQEETKSKTEINDIKSGWDKCIYVFFIIYCAP